MPSGHRSPAIEIYRSGGARISTNAYREVSRLIRAIWALFAQSIEQYPANTILTGFSRIPKDHRVTVVTVCLERIIQIFN
jgi:hypothetical protein